VSVEQTGFWDFSLQRYGEAGVADACLSLQDDYGLDVNMVLLCVWYGNCHGRFTRDQLHQLTDFAGTWAVHVVEPLRHARRWLKTRLAGQADVQGQVQEAADPQAVEQLRNRIKGLELEAEHLQQNQLQALLGDIQPKSSTPGPASTWFNLDLYLQTRVPPGNQDCSSNRGKPEGADSGYSLTSAADADGTGRNRAQLEQLLTAVVGAPRP